MNHQFARYGSLAVAAGLFIGGALEQGDNNVGAVLVTAGLIMLGAWLALEIHYLLNDPKHHHPDDNEEDKDG